MSAPLKGPIAWMAKNRVAANLLMLTIIVGGLVLGTRAKQEIFPEFEVGIVTISVAYPGASPKEVEQGIVLAIEEAARGIDGVKRVLSLSAENRASVRAELMDNADANRVHADIKNAIDRINSFPRDAEPPVVSLLTNQTGVISLVIYGEAGLKTLRRVADQARAALLQRPEITSVEISGAPPPEIAIEVPSAALRRYGLTLDDIARSVGSAAREIPAGNIHSPGGQVLVRLSERRDLGEEFEEIPVIANAAGTFVRVGELATVRDDFAETDEAAYFNGQPAVRLDVYRTGEQTPIEVAGAVKAYAEASADSLPPGVAVASWQDRSVILKERIDLLLRNAFLGLALVLLILGFFLELRLAFWVTLGIPISFTGGLLLMPAADVSLNMISLFAFIVTLGIVVDDAIIVGENIFAQRRQGKSGVRAAVDGVRQVGGPVVFAVLTSIAAFSPMMFVPGVSGKLFKVIPSVVIAVLVVSLVEALFILPAHLAHQGRPAGGRLAAFIKRRRDQIDRAFVWWTDKTYKPAVGAAVRRRYLTLAAGVAVLMVSVGLVGGGFVSFSFMPKIESDLVTASAALPVGSAADQTAEVQARLVSSAQQVLRELDAEEKTLGIYSQVGKPVQRGGPGGAALTSGGGHLADVQISLVTSEKRNFTAAELARRWREKLGPLAGLDRLSFSYSTGPSAGAPINVELSHPDAAVLERAAAGLATRLATYSGVTDIDDGLNRGKPQLDLRLTAEGRRLGISPTELGRQVRHAFFGAEALRQQRGRDELRVLVRLPLDERQTERTLSDMLIRTPQGGEVPLSRAAHVERGRSYTEIKRADGKRVANVTADIVPGVANAGQIVAALRTDVLPQLRAQYPRLTFSFEGEQRSQRESLSSLGVGFAIALLVIFALIAVPFRSYIQPVIVMSAIPFGFVGAVIGHLVMGFELSIISMMGIVALAGVVVNDSLLLIDTANRYRREKNIPAAQAIVAAGLRRFRPIILTSLTTFGGLAPMIFETSVQARFLIPMAISLGHGILFATFIILVLVPALYMIVEDIRQPFKTKARNSRTAQDYLRGDWSTT